MKFSIVSIIGTCTAWPRPVRSRANKRHADHRGEHLPGELVGGDGREIARAVGAAVQRRGAAHRLNQVVEGGRLAPARCQAESRWRRHGSGAGCAPPVPDSRGAAARRRRGACCAPARRRRRSGAAAPRARPGASDPAPRCACCGWRWRNTTPWPGVRLGPMWRSASPPGASILMTSAPMSPRIWVANGPSTIVVRSITRTPASGPDWSSLIRRE